MIPRYTLPEMAEIWSEEAMFSRWLEVEIAACEAWAKLGIVPAHDLEQIHLARFELAEYNRIFAQTKHDVISFTQVVARSVGDAGRWIHHGMTSSDVKDTALSMQLRDATELLLTEVTDFMVVLKDRAIEFKDTPCIGRSHGMHAEPMSFGLKFALWWDEMERHLDRLRAMRQRVATCMISGPVGTFATIPPQIEELVAEQLKLSPTRTSNQIIPRDNHAEYVQVLALLAATMEKIATEIRALQRTEVSEVTEPFGQPGYVTKGSSSMPHKRNPELCERACGLARLVRGYATTALENVTLWHERDISHSSAERVLLPDSSIAVHYMLRLMQSVVRDMHVDKARMAANINITRGLVFSPRVMLALVESGMERRAAYDLVQTMSLEVWKTSSDFKQLVKNHTTVNGQLSPSQIDNLFDVTWYLRFTDIQFARLGWKV